MKLIYSHLQKLLPDLNKEPQQLRDDLTMIEHFTNYFEKIDDQLIFDLDIKVNRGDCLSYYGLARDLSVYYNTKLELLKAELPKIENKKDLPIKIETDNVKRVMAIKISNLKNSQSPKWLKDFVNLHGTNSVNTLVDLTNYIMFIYGFPPHAFDTAKSTDQLTWQMNPGFKEFTSLDGSVLKVNKDILMINNKDKALSLSFWGGEACAIELDTTETIIEIAVYNPSTVRKNRNALKVTTEAATRLEKHLDTDTLSVAFDHLLSLILEHCSGQISSNLFDHYPNKRTLPQIKFDFNKPSQISGIEIPNDFTVDCFKRIGCIVKNELITPPSIRTDINIEADLTEEIIRFWGYQKIPTDQALEFKKLPDITPPIIYLIEQLKDKLVDLSYDEVLSWPIGDQVTDSETVVKTQNSINTKVVYLRQSLIPSLKKQLDRYQRFKLDPDNFFEIGTIFFKEGDNYTEKTAVAIYSTNPQQLEKDLKSLSLNDYKITDSNFVEIIIDNLDKVDSYDPKIIKHSAYELTSQLIILDANLTLKEKKDPLDLI
jgi:phenylalanyl-tRNA synthetase beta chain